jgi:hypothetical protein
MAFNLSIAVHDRKTERYPAVLLRRDLCALPQENKDGALGEDKEGTSPSVLSDLPA